MRISVLKVSAIVLLPVILALIIAGCSGQSSTSNPAETAKEIETAKNINPIRAVDSGKIAAVDGTEYDWGYINISGGNVDHTFALSNSGDDDLVLKGAFTSCACTKVTIELPDGTVSPTFGMKYPKGWAAIIKPGEEFKVTLQLDPMFHGPNETGPLTRSGFLVTSAPHDDALSNRLPMIKNGTVTRVKASGLVVSEEDFLKTSSTRRYRHALGDFRFLEKEADFSVIKQSHGKVRYNFPFVYTGEEPVKITGTPTSCGCTRASISNNVLQPGDQGELLVEFDPNFHEEPEGRFFKTIMITTEPAQSKSVELKMWAEVDLDLGPDAYKYAEHNDDDEHSETDEDAH